jgi:hypothetical protein
VESMALPRYGILQKKARLLRRKLLAMTVIANEVTQSINYESRN